MQLDRNSPKPLHMQLEEIIRQKLANGEWAAGELMPSENKICQEYGVSRMTARNVITRLEQEGLVDRVMGKGTYVRPPKVRAKVHGGNLKFNGIVSQLQSMGYTITMKVLSIEKKVIPQNAVTFGLSPDCVYYEVKRLRYMNDSPMSVHVNHVPVHLAPGLEDVYEANQVLYTVLEKTYGLPRDMVSETWRAERPPKWVADILEIKTSQPVLMDISMTHDAEGRVFNAEMEYYRGDKSFLYFEF